MRFTAFVTMTIQRTVTGRPAQPSMIGAPNGLVITVIRIPKEYMTNAAYQ
jgi:hypothetical protein